MFWFFFWFFLLYKFLCTKMHARGVYYESSLSYPGCLWVNWLIKASNSSKGLGVWTLCESRCLKSILPFYFYFFSRTECHLLQSDIIRKRGDGDPTKIGCLFKKKTKNIKCNKPTLVLQNKIREQCYIVEISKAVHTSVHPSYVKSCYGSGRLTRVFQMSFFPATLSSSSLVIWKCL